jgi:hypothetical protein
LRAPTCQSSARCKTGARKVTPLPIFPVIDAESTFKCRVNILFVGTYNFVLLFLVEKVVIILIYAR